MVYLRFMITPEAVPPPTDPSGPDPTPIGWREWVTLPAIGVRRIKAKIDTGARSSSIHAFNITPYVADDGSDRVRFDVHPRQRNEDHSVTCDAAIHDRRTVRSSSGEASDRIVIRTDLRWNGEVWPIDLTLAARFEMGFRMLIGREAVRGRHVVDPGRSYFGPKPKRKKRRQS